MRTIIIAHMTVDNTPQSTGKHTHSVSMITAQLLQAAQHAWSGHEERRHYSVRGASTDHHLKEKETLGSSLILKCYISLQVGLDTTTKLDAHYNIYTRLLVSTLQLLSMYYISRLEGGTNNC